MTPGARAHPPSRVTVRCYVHQLRSVIAADVGREPAAAERVDHGGTARQASRGSGMR